MGFLGTPTIAPYAYFAGKLSALACWVSLVARYFWPALVWFRRPWLDWLGAVLLVVGFLLMLAGGLSLGRSLRMGLPTEKTELRTSGVFRYTRNPMYLGGSLTLLAAIAWTVNPVIATLVAVAATAHHKIVLAEENYLAGEFGDAWVEYSRRVPRYL